MREIITVSVCFFCLGVVAGVVFVDDLRPPSSVPRCVPMPSRADKILTGIGLDPGARKILRDAMFRESRGGVP